MPWGTWITCEEIFNYGSTEANVTPGHRRAARLRLRGAGRRDPARSPRSRSSTPAASPTRPSPGSTACSTRPRTAATPRSTASSRAQATRVRRPRELRRHAAGARDQRAAELRRRRRRTRARRYRVEWVTLEEPNPLTDTVRIEAQAKGATIFNRTEGIWSADQPRVLRLHVGRRRRARAGLGVHAARARRRRAEARLRIDERRTTCESPDNLVVVPRTGDIWVQEDGGGEQYVRGVTRRGEIYDFAQHASSAPSRVLRRLLQPRRRDVLPQPAGRPARRGRDARDAGEREARLHVRDLGAVRALTSARRAPRHLGGFGAMPTLRAAALPAALALAALLAPASALPAPSRRG